MPQLFSKHDNLLVQQASAYVRHGEVVSFFELQRRAMAQRDLVLGYRNRAAGGEWVLNPPEKHQPLQVSMGPETLKPLNP